ncbi:MAG: hypothetical protein AAF215_04500 [Cyanobacteria bacterium P01_A01_bin.123]
MEPMYRGMTYNAIAPKTNDQVAFWGDRGAFKRANVVLEPWPFNKPGDQNKRG